MPELTEETIQKYAILCEDFEQYAALNLKIKTKSGAIKSLIFNDPQKHIHKLLEDQLSATGKIRALILKGRQQGACLSPDMKVMKSNFSWSKIEDIQVGDRLISVDENANGLTKSGRNQTRKMRVAVVEGKYEFNKEVFEIVLDNGTVLKSTGDHRWMSKQRGGDCVIWRDVNNLKVGDVLRAAVYKPENIDRMHEDGWIGGVLDADGSCSTTGSPMVSFNQVEGIVLDKYKNYLNQHGIRFYENIDRRTKVGKYTKLGDKPVHCVRVDRFPDMVKLISRCNPVRFNKEAMYENRKLSTSSNGFVAWPKIVSIKSLGVSKVIDIQTSHKTFVAEGIVSHNSTYTEGRFYWRTSLNFGKQAYIMTHEQKATNNLFAMAKHYYDFSDADYFKPSTSASNSKELVFDKLSSGYKVGTAGASATGRSGTIQYLHNSELAFWSNADDHFSGIVQCVPSGYEAEGTEIIIESTAKGIGGKFHELWMQAVRGESEYIAIFVPWYWSYEYRADAKDIVLTDEELKMQKIHGVDNEQIAWRRLKIGEMGKDLCDQEYPYTWEEAFLSTGRTVFDKDHMLSALSETWSPSFRMVLEQTFDDKAIRLGRKGDDYYRFVDRDNGELRVWFKPEEGKKYVIGSDVSEGLEHGDYSCADVLEYPSGQQVAQWHGHIAPDLLGKMLYILGMYYNKAFIGVEANNHGILTNTTLRDLYYPNLYAQRAIDDRGSGDKETKRIGWMTTSKSKPYIIDQLGAELRDGTHGLACKESVQEMLSFVVQESGGYGAQLKCYDDRVMSRAIAGEMLRAVY